MKSRVNWNCWEIMQCDDMEDCPAKTHPEIPCWELANEVGDYRRFCNICQDCLVYVLKTDTSLLSDKQRQSILQKKVACPLAA